MRICYIRRSYIHNSYNKYEESVYEKRVKALKKERKKYINFLLPNVTS